MERYVSIHGHFYQPPRENPWLEAIEFQESAYPYHDWNERITAECYAPNANTRILDEENRIVSIVNNYASMSFNFGPTLLSWLEEKKPEVYGAVLTADRASAARFSGHGSAMAQPYNHMILPLAHRRDKETQTLWGIRDFEHRFGRKPEGMWLPETAVDVESLEVFAGLGVRFTVLAPHQASHVRAIGEGEWQDVRDGGVDTTRAYRLSLPSGRSIDLFFYDGPISRAVAFERLLSKGEFLADRLQGAFSDKRNWPQLVHIATDGETYGHHHRHGDMALAYALHTIETQQQARLTNYGEFLEKHPPTHEVRIVENTSWSCAHGVGRWREDCGCQTGVHPGWSQAWRAPLREALDWLRDTLAPRYEEKAGELFADPWASRDDYIEVILDRSPEKVGAFLGRHALHPLTETERITARKLLELQRHTQLMFTSCGWFFDDIAGIEARQIIQYAGRALQLSGDLFGDPLEEGFLERLEKARSNIAEAGDGRRIYEQSVRMATVSLEKVGAHYGVSSLFAEYGEEERVYCYQIDREDYRLLTSGRARLALGRARVTSEITGESERVVFGVLHLGDHNLSGGIGRFSSEEDYERLARELGDAFQRADLTEILRMVDRHFGSEVYSLRLLFRDEQRRVLSVILKSVLAETDGVYWRLYEEHAPLMRFLSSHGIRQPRGFQMAAEVALNSRMHRALEAEEPEVEQMRAILEEAKNVGITLHEDGLGLALQRSVERLSDSLRAQPDDLRLLETLEGLVELARSLPFEVDFWKAQNTYYDMLQTTLPAVRTAAQKGAADSSEWLRRFLALGEKLSVRVVT
ncbi:MAG TPA: DUF3536 domain-containing protein [Thermoanaerobaculia bacterium]